MRVSDLVVRARGLLNEAYPRAELHRWNPDNTDKLITIDLEKALAHDPANDLALTRWDRIKVYTRDEVAFIGHRIVTISGSVKRYGVYTHSQDMHISDLLRMAGGPTPDAYLERAVLIHQHEDGPPSMEYVNIGAVLRGEKTRDMAVLDNDQLNVYAVGQAQFVPDHLVTIMGEVVTPGLYPRTESMKISDLLILSGGFRPSAGSSVVITHARRMVDAPNSKTVSSITVNFDSHGKCAPQDDLTLEDGDVVTIQATGGFLDHVQTIRVMGAVNKPGAIPLTSENMRLSDAIKLAGGLRPEAFAQGAEFYRDPKTLETGSQRALAASLGSLNDLLNDNEYIIERGKSRLEIIKATGQAEKEAAGGLGGLAALGGAAAATGASSAAASAAGSQLGNQELVTPARRMGAQQIEPDGNIAVNLPGALKAPKGVDDIVLVEGDTITIPKTPTTVQLVGAVMHQRGVLFKKSETLQQYVEEAGGFAPDAAKDRIEVIRVGGGLISGKKVREILPGDVIVVPNKVLAAKISSHSNGISSFFSSLTSSALIFKFASSLFGL